MRCEKTPFTRVFTHLNQEYVKEASSGRNNFWQHIVKLCTFILYNQTDQAKRVSGFKKIEMVKRLIILFIILTSLEFFSFAFLSKGLTQMAGIAGIALILVVIILQLVYDKGDGFRMNFKWGVGLILLSVLTSMLMAYSAHNQNIQTTLIAQRFMYFYLFYYALHMLRIPDYELERTIIYLSIIYIFFYWIQYIVYPVRIFDVRIVEDRGTIRIFQAGLSYMILAYFYILNKSFDRSSPIRVTMLLMFFSVIVLMGTRQILFSIMLLTMINILLSNRVKSKLLVILIALLAVIPVALMFQDILSSIINLSREQTVGFEKNIRILSGTFFLTDFFPNRIAYFTGNGVDSMNSSYGMMIQMYKDVFGFYQSDVGIIGDYSKFGIFFIAGVFAIIYRILYSRLDDTKMYIRYFIFFMILTSVTGAGVFGEANSIVTMCIILYIIDVKKHNQLLEHEEEQNSAFAINDTVEFIEEPEAVKQNLPF